MEPSFCSDAHQSWNGDGGSKKILEISQMSVLPEAFLQNKPDNTLPDVVFINDH